MIQGRLSGGGPWPPRVAPLPVPSSRAGTGKQGVGRVAPLPVPSSRAGTGKQGVGRVAPLPVPSSRAGTGKQGVGRVAPLPVPSSRAGTGKQGVGSGAASGRAVQASSHKVVGASTFSARPCTDAGTFPDGLLGDVFLCSGVWPRSSEPGGWPRGRSSCPTLEAPLPARPQTATRWGAGLSSRGRATAL